MARYVLGRLIQLVLVLIGVGLVVFINLQELLGDVAQLLLGEHATAEQLVRLRRQLGLDQPVWVQYIRSVAQATHGNLGTSLRSNHPAIDDVLNAFPVSYAGIWVTR